MRQGQQQQHHQQKRMRGRNNNNNNRKGPNPLSRSYESNGPDVKIRGTAAHIADKYVQLARDATSSGDPVAAENYLQHAEHYYRILAAAQPQFQTSPGFVRADDESRDEDGDEDGYEGQGGFDGQQQPQQHENRGQQGYPQNAPQPYGQNEGGSGQPRQYQPREQREQRDYQPREQREYQPRDQRENREPRHQPAPNAEAQSGLPAFITGGGAPEQQNGPDGEVPSGRSRRRRFGRYRNGGEQGGAEGGAPNPEPEVAPGE